MSTCTDVLPTSYTDTLRTLTDEVPGFGGKRAKEIVSKELGAPVGDIFQDFSDEPLKAASLGQVHTATYKGRKVAIKVQRAGLKELFDKDLKVLKKLAVLLEQFDPKADGADRDWVSIYEESERLYTSRSTTSTKPAMLNVSQMISRTLSGSEFPRFTARCLPLVFLQWNLWNPSNSQTSKGLKRKVSTAKSCQSKLPMRSSAKSSKLLSSTQIPTLVTFALTRAANLYTMVCTNNLREKSYRACTGAHLLMVLNNER